jgi:hypothetical protein
MPTKMLEIGPWDYYAIMEYWNGGILEGWVLKDNIFYFNKLSCIGTTADKASFRFLRTHFSIIPAFQ